MQPQGPRWVGHGDHYYDNTVGPQGQPEFYQGPPGGLLLILPTLPHHRYTMITRIKLAVNPFILVDFMVKKPFIINDLAR